MVRLKDRKAVLSVPPPFFDPSALARPVSPAHGVGDVVHPGQCSGTAVSACMVSTEEPKLECGVLFPLKKEKIKKTHDVILKCSFYSTLVRNNVTCST